MRDVKQVIVMRNDLNMRKGKMIAQGAHASISFITRQLQSTLNGTHDSSYGKVLTTKVKLDDAEQQWIESGFAKICCRVESEEELLEVFQKAKVAGLTVHMITDSGKTEFDGVPTKTCLAIGPDYNDKIDPITGHLKLL